MPNNTNPRTYLPRQQAMTRTVSQPDPFLMRPASASSSVSGDPLAEHRVVGEPYYRTVADEVELYEAA
jgi:hypothetical protein